MDIVTEIVLILTGAVVGYCITKIEHQNDYSAQLFNEYKQMAQELSKILEDLLTLSMLPQNYSKEYCSTVDSELSKYFFKYYLVLPQQVLEEINCLHACLQCGGKYFYMVDRTGKFPVLRPCKTTEEFNNLFKDVALIETRIKGNYERLPRSLTLKCQARHVITVMHNCWNFKEYHKWQKKLPKRTVFQLENQNNIKNN